MNRIIKLTLIVAFIANAATLAYFIFDSKALQEKIDNINNIRVLLPESYQAAIAEKVLTSSETLSKQILTQASKNISEEAARTSKANNDSLTLLSNNINSNLLSVIQLTQSEILKLNNACGLAVKNFAIDSGERIASSLEYFTNQHASASLQINKLIEKSQKAIDQIYSDQKNQKYRKHIEAEAAFSRYLENPTNDIALLYLQIAIRRNPAELKYIKEMKTVVEQNGMLPDLIQEYQAMLSYCLDQAPTNCFETLASMVNELRTNISQMEIASSPSDETENDDQRISVLENELTNNELLIAFDENAKKNAERQIEIIKELKTLNPSTNDYSLAYAKAELVNHIATARKRILEYLDQTKQEIKQIENRKVVTKEQLHIVLDDLSSAVISQPTSLALQTIQSLYGLNLSTFPTNITEICRKEFGTLEKLIKDSSALTDRMKANKIKAYINELTSNDIALELLPYTEQLKKLDIKSKIISKYIGCFAHQEIASEMLEIQLKFLNESKELQRKRLKSYQSYATKEMQSIAQAIKQYKEDGWTKSYKKNEAAICLQRLVKIDPVILVPEINELYQYEYSQLMTDFNAWVEDNKAYEVKARFMVKLESIEKKKLEEF